MGKGGSKQTVQTTAPDAASQSYINRLRTMGTNAAQGALSGGPYFTGPLQQTPGQMAQPFMNPYISNVVDGVRGEFDHLRASALMGADQQATQAGAFGGSRHGIMAGARLGELDRAQTSQIGGLLQGGYSQALGQGMQFAEHQRQLRERQMQEGLFRSQNALNFANLGMGPVGQTSTQKTPTNWFGNAAGGAMAGAAVGGPWGAAIGGGIGLLGSFL